MDKTLRADVDSVKLYCDGVNNLDPSLISRSMHFPHYRIEIDGSVLIWNAKADDISSSAATDRRFDDRL